MLIKQHPFVFDWAKANLKDKFPNYRTCSIDLPSSQISKYFNSDANRFMFRGVCLLPTSKPLPQTRRTKLSKNPSSSLHLISETNSPVKRPKFDLKTHMKAKKVNFYLFIINYNIEIISN
jgi:hypothetical protein